MDGDDEEYVCDFCKKPILENQIFVESYKLVARDPNQAQGYVKGKSGKWQKEPIYVHSGHFRLYPAKG